MQHFIHSCRSAISLGALICSSFRSVLSGWFASASVVHCTTWQQLSSTRSDCCRTFALCIHVPTRRLIFAISRRPRTIFQKHSTPCDIRVGIRNKITLPVVKCTRKTVTILEFNCQMPFVNSIVRDRTFSLQICHHPCHVYFSDFDYSPVMRGLQDYYTLICGLR